MKAKRNPAGSAAAGSGADVTGAAEGTVQVPEVGEASDGAPLSQFDEYLALLGRKKADEAKLQRAAQERRQMLAERRQMSGEDDGTHEQEDAHRMLEASQVRRLEAKLKCFWSTRYSSSLLAVSLS